MASACNRFSVRRSLSSVKSAIRSCCPKASGSPASQSATGFSLPSKSTPSPIRLFFSSRCPVELGCVQSLLPLHSAVAAARMTSCLSTSSASCRALLQGTLCCTCPGL